MKSEFYRAKNSFTKSRKMKERKLETVQRKKTGGSRVPNNYWYYEISLDEDSIM